jgi:hypothetical protein
MNDPHRLNANPHTHQSQARAHVECALTLHVCTHAMTQAVFYGATSISATVFTKAVMTGYGFRFLPFMMTLVSYVCTHMHIDLRPKPPKIDLLP